VATPPFPRPLNFVDFDMRTSILSDQRGIVTLFTVMVVFFVSLLVAVSVQYLGLGELQHGFTGNLSEQAFALADGCSDLGLQRLRMNASYTGEMVTVDDDQCVITVTGGGGTRQIDVAGTVNGTFTRKIRLNLSITTASPRNNVTMTGWQELTL